MSMQTSDISTSADSTEGIIKQCHERPEHTTVKQWCLENSIHEKYFWFIQVRFSNIGISQSK